ncbi:diguanylate cyclase [Paraburkholderia sp. GAS334]|uniref:sensor domain-containing diguanylate cyclase n=1 Tax=Paraburkholderia sp. GAS334 TaxID=3035131 RepID=UPI003D1C98EA
MQISHLFRRLQTLIGSPRMVIAGGVVTAFGMLGICAVLLYEGRQDALAHATESSRNTLLVIERDIARNVELYDLSLQAVVDNVRQPDVMSLPDQLRNELLFDRAATAKDLGSMLVLDRAGNVIIDSGSEIPRRGNFADRNYFTVHRDNPDVGLYLSPPYESRLRGGDPSIALSRRINNPDGSFAGVVVGAVRLEYFRRLLSGLQLGPHSTMALIHANGQLIMRAPYDPKIIGRDLNGTGPFERMIAQPEGQFVDQASIDGIRRVYTYKRLTGLPLIMEVAPAEADIYEAWKGRAARIAILMTVFGLTFIGLSVLLASSLAKKAQAELMLTMLSRTDSLTGLNNRRALDDLLAREWQRARRSKESLSILFVDVDYFKAYNDAYGHQAGDDALAAVARCISANIRRPGDSAARYGGEEFVIVLPDTSGPGALGVAETIRMKVAALGVEHATSQQGRLTVSIGVATWQGKKTDTVYHVIRAADEALYTAKASGRNTISATILA